MGTFVIRGVAVLPSVLIVSPSDGTGVTQYRPSGEIGEWKSWIWLVGTAGPLNTVSQVWAKIAWCGWRAAQYSPAM